MNAAATTMLKIDDILAIPADILNNINSSLELNCTLRMSLEPSQTKPNETVCPVIFDSVLCWPQTSAGTLAILPCFNEFKGMKYDSSQNATRYCYPNGTWENANFDQCQYLGEATMIHEFTPSVDLPFYIYCIGYVLSLISLSLGLVVFLHFKDLRCLRNTIHANLFLTYILAALLWLSITLIYQVRPGATGNGCVCLVILLHYFTLTNFFWMLVEGLYLYTLVVETFSGDNMKFRMYAFIGWGCPAIVVATWTVAKSFVPATQPEQINGLQIACTWMHESNIDWIFKGPICACLVINLVFLIRIMWVLIIKLRSANTAETRQYKKATKALLVLIPLLGITYLVVLMVPQDDSVSSNLFTYLQAFLISTQGFSVSLLYCFLNSEVKNALHHRWEIWRETRNIGADAQMEYRKHQYGINSKEYSSQRSRTESLRLTSHSNGSNGTHYS